MSNLLMVVGLIYLGVSFVAVLIIYSVCIMAGRRSEAGRIEFLTRQKRAELAAQSRCTAQPEEAREPVVPAVGNLRNQPAR
jgi:hypothetical protein